MVLRFWRKSYPREYMANGNWMGLSRIRRENEKAIRNRQALMYGAIGLATVFALFWR